MLAGGTVTGNSSGNVLTCTSLTVSGNSTLDTIAVTSAGSGGGDSIASGAALNLTNGCTFTENGTWNGASGGMDSINCDATSTIVDNGTWNEAGSINGNGTLTIGAFGTLNNSGSLDITGNLTNYGTINNYAQSTATMTTENNGFPAQVQYYNWSVDGADSVNGQNPLTVDGNPLPTWDYWGIYWNGSNWMFGTSPQFSNGQWTFSDMGEGPATVNDPFGVYQGVNGNPGSFSITLVTPFVGTIRVASGGSLANQGSGQLNNFGSLTVNNSATLANNGTLTNNGTLVGNIVDNAILDIVSNASLFFGNTISSQNSTAVIENTGSGQVTLSQAALDSFFGSLGSGVKAC